LQQAGQLRTDGLGEQHRTTSAANAEIAEGVILPARSIVSNREPLQEMPPGAGERTGPLVHVSTREGPVWSCQQPVIEHEARLRAEHHLGQALRVETQTEGVNVRPLATADYHAAHHPLQLQARLRQLHPSARESRT